MKTSTSKQNEIATVFEIHDAQDVVRLQMEMLETHVYIEQRFIAQELVENMVASGCPGHLSVTDDVIETDQEIPDPSVYDHVMALIYKARHMLRNGERGKIEESSPAEYGGKGFLTILSSGWDLSVERFNCRGMKIVATRIPGQFGSQLHHT